MSAAAVSYRSSHGVIAAGQLSNSKGQYALMKDLTLQVAIMKQLRAENIVRFLGVCTKGSQTMLVTEFMAGGDLFNRLSISEAGGELSWTAL